MTPDGTALGPSAPVAAYDEQIMPELPELQIVAELMGEAVRGAQVDSALAPGINTLKTLRPPLSALEGLTVQGVRRRGKHLIVDFSDGLSLLIHLMSAGRLQLYERRAGPRDRSSRLLLRVRAPARDGGSVGAAGAERAAGAAGTVSAAGTVDAAGTVSAAGAVGAPPELELRLRELGPRQAAWAKLLPCAQLDGDPALAGLGPDAWPQTPVLAGIAPGSRPLNALLRDQRVIAGIGRSWADEILWEARLSPYRRLSDLDAAQLSGLREAIFTVLDGAIAHYRRELSLPLPDRMPAPLRIHRHRGDPCPRCGATLRGVHLQENVIAYCPDCQTAGRILKDRRLSRILR